MSDLFYFPFQQALDDIGESLDGAKLNTYEAGTSNPLATYSDQDLTVPNTNPIIADAAGRFGKIYLQKEAYKFVLTDKNDVTIWTADDVELFAQNIELDDFATNTDAADRYIGYDSSGNAEAKLLNEWVNPGGTPTFVSTTQFTVDDTSLETDFTTYYRVGRMIKLEGTTPFEAYGRITSSSYSSPTTTVNYTIDPGFDTPDNTLSDVSFGIVDKEETSDPNTMPIEYKYDLGISKNSVDPTNDLDIEAGGARDALNFRDMVLSSGITKQIDAVWAEGTNAGGFPSGLSGGTVQPNTTYRVFIISKTDGTVDGGFDTDSAAANLLSDASAYTYYREIGTVTTDGSGGLDETSDDTTAPSNGGYEVFTSSGTWTKPNSDFSFAFVTVVGGGAGGGGAGTGATGTAGGNSSFGSLCSATGGAGGVGDTGGGTGGAGGSGSGGTFNFSGESGDAAASNGGAGGSVNGRINVPSEGGETTTGAGDGDDGAGYGAAGAGGNTGVLFGGGGGAGGTAEEYIDESSLSATETVTVGSGGSGGGGFNTGGDGTAGVVIVRWY